MPLTPFTPGQRVRITHAVPRQSQALTSITEGTVTRYYQGKTGSWFAHSKDHKLWLDRLEIVKDNGELAVINLDRFTTVEAIGPAPAAAPAPLPS
jgi:hypothetical protein